MQQVPCMNMFAVFCDILWILVCISNESERSGKTVYRESVESISFSWPIICLHNTHFPSEYNCNQGVSILQG